MRVLLLIAAVSIAACSIYVPRTENVISSIGEQRDGCRALIRVVRDFALAAGYAEIAVPPSQSSQSHLLVAYRHDRDLISVYRKTDSCVVYSSDLERVVGALRAHRIPARMQQETSAHEIEIIPFAP